MRGLGRMWRVGEGEREVRGDEGRGWRGCQDRGVEPLEGGRRQGAEPRCWAGGRGQDTGGWKEAEEEGKF